MSDADVLAGKFADMPGVSVRRAVFVGVDSGMALVDMGDSRFPVEFGTVYIPVPGDPVMVLSVGAQRLMLPSGAKPRAGTVLTVSSPTATVDTLIGTVIATIVGSAPSSGARVLLDWTEDGPVIVGTLATTPVTPEPPPDPGTGGTTTRSAVFRAVDAGSTDRHQARWWTGNPRAGNTTYGAWFYLTQIKDTIPSTAQLVSLEFKVNRTQDKGGPPRWVLHNQFGKGPLPGFSTPYAEWDPPNGWHVPPNPTDWFNALKAGGAWMGIGLNQGGDNVFASLAQDAESGALRISWKV